MKKKKKRKRRVIKTTAESVSFRKDEWLMFEQILIRQARRRISQWIYVLK